MTALCFFDWSQHLCFRSHGLEAKNEQCAPGSGTDERQRCQHTSSIHAGSPSIIRTLQWARTFTNTSPKQRLLLETRYRGRCHATPRVYVHKHGGFSYLRRRGRLPAVSGRSHHSVNGPPGAVIPESCRNFDSTPAS